jgi:hypothetical protein
VTATATSPDGKIHKTVQETVYWQSTSQSVAQVFEYGLVVDNAGAACVDTHGTTPIVLKNVWISGDFCPAGNVGLLPPAANTGSVYIGGQYQGRNNTSIGSGTLPYGSADIVGGCTNQGKAEICSDSANSNVFASGAPSVDPSSLELPTIDATNTYAEADWHNPTCSQGSFTFDSDSIQNGTTPTTTLLPNTASFNCTVKDSGGNTVGTLAWNNTTKALSISGTIWIDGNVDLSNSGTYTGNGTIYVNGVITGASNITVCGPGNTTPSGYGCPGTWDATQGNLGVVVVNPSNAATAFNRTGNGELDFTLLVNQGYTDSGGTVVMGPVLADTASIGGSSGSIVPSAPPDSFPSTVQLTASWVVQPGSWRQTQ